MVIEKLESGANGSLKIRWELKIRKAKQNGLLRMQCTTAVQRYGTPKSTVSNLKYRVSKVAKEAWES
jgi:hypothetical protein